MLSTVRNHKKEKKCYSIFVDFCYSNSLNYNLSLNSIWFNTFHNKVLLNLPSIYTSIHSPTNPSIHSSITHLSSHSSIPLLIHPSLHPSLSPLIYLFIRQSHPSTHLSSQLSLVKLSIHPHHSLFAHSFIYPSIYLFILYVFSLYPLINYLLSYSLLY